MIRAAILGSVMILVILLLRFTLGKRLPRGFFRLLWLLAALRLAVPFSFTVDIEVYPKVPETAFYQQGTVLDTVGAVKTETVSEARSTVEPDKIIRTLHILGVTLCGGFMSFAYIRMRRLALGGKPLSKEAAARWKNVTVLHGDGFDSPFSCGVIRPVVFIPSRMLKLDIKQLDAVIAHEEQHIRAGDQLLKWLLCAVACLHWYNPLAWVMLSYASRDIELACDESVLRRYGEKADYAMTLIAAEEIRHTAAVCSFGAPVLNERIEFIMKSRKTTALGFTAAGVLLALMTAFFVGVNAVEVEKEEPTRIVAPAVDASDAVETAREEESTYEADGGGSAESERVYEATPNILNEPQFEVFVSGSAHHAELGEPHIHEDGCEVTTVEIREYEVLEPSESHEFFCPLEKHYGITGKFGTQVNPAGVTVFNTGVNVKAAHGEAVCAVASGKVISATYDRERGNSVSIDHGNGYVTVYSHCRKLDVKVGDFVEAGECIGEVGMTGAVTGPNLGFAVIVDGAYIDPAPLFE